ncbi:hypothetical protein [Saccharibacillus brassicae]|uniref:Uncharacterized protein n=1 Tax=Saccharibacillus brassicae TaxID=2583377 RepID=A0A4Y6UWM7_SACBS|nr:hypothetical protein [Saccharibacillus brassicae]QDH22123.1 hypothetical protein FFV09_15490 [Saccharibacillus brassicae]
MTPLPKHYGTYEIPALIRQLFELEHELQQEDLSLDRAFPCMLFEDDFRYSFTPLDVIPLASTGMDGIHYGFLTDFGLAPDLDHAWIVIVSPVDSDCPVRPVAANLFDWLRAMYTDADALINAFEHGADYRAYVRTREPHEPDEEASEVRRRLVERFGIRPIQDMGAYLDEMREQRKQAVDRETEDGIGVVSTQRTADRSEQAAAGPTVRAGDPGDPVIHAGDPADPVNCAGDPADPVNCAGNPADPVNCAGDPADPVNCAGDPADPVNCAGNPADPVNCAGDPSDSVIHAGDPADPVNCAGNPADPVNCAGDPAASGANRLSPTALPAVDRDFDWGEKREEIQSFWAQASSDEKHVFLRNAQLYSIFQQPSCLEWCMDRLKRDGLPEYAANLGSSFEYVLEPQAQESHTSVIMWSSESASYGDEQDD